MFPIVSISGFPGSGKSTLCRRLLSEYDIDHIAYDDFETLTSRSAHELEDWIDAGMPLEALRQPEFTACVVSSACKRPVLIETPLGPLHDIEGIDTEVSIWLDIDLDIALLRAVHKVVSEEWLSVSLLQSWLSGYHDAYTAFVRPGLIAQRQQVGDKCSTVLNARLSPNDIFLKATSILDGSFQRRAT